MGQGINFITRANQEAPRRQERAKLFTPEGGIHYYDSSVFGGTDTGEKIKTYSTKSEQIKANRGWAYAANDRISAFFGSSIKWQLKQLGKDDSEVIIKRHALLKLLREPNDAMTGSQLLYLHASYLNLVGESYIIPVGQNSQDKSLPAALHILPAHTVEYKINKDTGDEIITFGRDQYLENTINETKFFRDYNPDPERPYHGLSKIAAAAQAIDTDSKAKFYNQNFFANAAKPSIVIETEKQLSDLAYNRFKSQLSELHTGIANAHKPLLLENGAKSHQLSLTQRDMDFLQGRKFNMDEILAMFGMSPSMLGMIADSNRSNMEAAEYNFAKYVMLDRAKAFSSFIYKYLLADQYGDDHELTFENFIPANEEADTKRRESAVNRYQTVNEIRAERGLKALPGGDQLFRDANLVPLDSTGAPAGDDEDDDQDKDDKDDKGGGNEAPPDKDEEGKRSQRQTRAQQGEQRIKTAAPLLDAFESGFARVTRRTFEQQRQAIAKALGDFYGTRASKDDDLLKIVTEVLSAASWDPLLTDQYVPVYYALMSSAIIDSYRQIQDVDRPVSDDQMRAWVRERSQKISGEINDETRKQVVLTIKDGLAAGETHEQLRARVELLFGPSSSVRIERRTHYESGRVVSQADVLAWDASEVVEGKQWYTAHDPKVCAHCQAMDGKIVPLEGAFFDVGDVFEVDVVTKAGKKTTQKRKLDYEDIIGPPLDPGCRCVLLPVMKEGFAF